MAQPVDKNAKKWVKHKDKEQWTLLIWPWELIIEFRPQPGDPNPFKGSLRASNTTLSELRAWATSDEAAVGILDWGLERMAQSYHELAQFRAGG